MEFLEVYKRNIYIIISVTLTGTQPESFSKTGASVSNEGYVLGVPVFFWRRGILPAFTIFDSFSGARVKDQDSADI